MACSVRLIRLNMASVKSLTQSTSPVFGFGLAVAKNEPSLGSRSLAGLARLMLKGKQPAFANLDSAGSRLSVRGIIIGFSVAYGIACSSSSGTFAMAGDDCEAEGSHVTATTYNNSVIDRDQQARWAFVKKVWIPSLFLVNVVMMSWNHPLELAIKIILALLSTKPNPLSVYIYIEQLCNQYKPQHPWSYYSKPLKARTVDVTDYMLFSIGRVVVQDQEFILIGVLGAWWVWPSYLRHYLQFQTGFDEIRIRARKRLTLQVPKQATQCS